MNSPEPTIDDQMNTTPKKTRSLWIKVVVVVGFFSMNYSLFAVRKVQTKKLVLGDFQNFGHLKVLNDTKLILDD